MSVTQLSSKAAPTADKISESSRSSHKRSRDLNSRAQSSGSVPKRPSKLGTHGERLTETSSVSLTEENLRKLPSKWKQKPPKSPELHKALSSALKRSGKLNKPPKADVQDSDASAFSQETSLARKIRRLIDSLPAISSRFLSAPNTPPVVDSDGRPTPPPGAVRIQDPELISLLSNPSIMSGSDGRRQSVWSMLDAIEPPRPGNTGTDNIDIQSDYADSDRSSVMMYSPLIPSADSVIELAALEDVAIASDGPSPARWVFASWAVWPTFWPFNEWKAKAPDDAPSQPSQSGADPESPIDGAEEKKEVLVQRVWKPSTTKLSFETMWWGYRIYLPPPVLAILDDQSVEATKQAATITAALTWFFTNLPVSSFPPPLQSAMVLLQRLIPFISYIGTFISWSWSTIKGFDRGHGVILTATWLLPIALIPGTWHAPDVPPPSSPVSPMPIPIAMPALIPMPPIPLEVTEAAVTESIPVVVQPPTPLPSKDEPEPPAAGPSNSNTKPRRKPSAAAEKEKSKNNKSSSTLRRLKRTLT